jgi:hypothetical protein
MVNTPLPREIVGHEFRFGNLLATPFLRHFSKRRGLTMVGVLAVSLGVYGVIALGLTSTPQSQTRSALSPALDQSRRTLIEPLTFADPTSLETQWTIYSLAQRGAPLTPDQIASVIGNSNVFDLSVSEDALSKKYINSIYLAYQDSAYGTTGIGTGSWLEYATVLQGQSRAPSETTGSRQ